MAGVKYHYAFPDRFVSGSIGEAGGRAFFVQVRQGSRITNVVCLRRQLEALAEHIEEVLDEVYGGPWPNQEVPPTPTRASDVAPLDVPLEEDFRAGTMEISWLPCELSLKVQLFSYGAYPEFAEQAAGGSGEPGGEYGLLECLEVLVTPQQGREFAARTRWIVGPTVIACPFCAQPLHPCGHVCPRCNGYRRPLGSHRGAFHAGTSR